MTPKKTTRPTQPLVVRTLVHDGKTYVYLVNDSPWTVTAEVDIRSPKPCELQRLDEETPSQLSGLGDQMTWTLDLKPFDVTAAVLSNADAQIETWRVSVDRATYARLRRSAEELKGRVLKLRQPDPINVLANPSFEASAERIPDCIFFQGDGIAVQPDAGTSFAGDQSLKIASQGPVAWMRSDPFEPPKTGRIAVIWKSGRRSWWKWRIPRRVIVKNSYFSIQPSRTSLATFFR